MKNPTERKRSVGFFCPIQFTFFVIRVGQIISHFLSFIVIYLWEENTKNAQIVTVKWYLCTLLWAFLMRLGRSKLIVRVGHLIKKMVESYENSIKNNG